MNFINPSVKFNTPVPHLFLVGIFKMHDWTGTFIPLNLRRLLLYNSLEIFKRVELELRENILYHTEDREISVSGVFYILWPRELSLILIFHTKHNTCIITIQPLQNFKFNSVSPKEPSPITYPEVTLSLYLRLLPFSTLSESSGCVPKNLEEFTIHCRYTLHVQTYLIQLDFFGSGFFAVFLTNPSGIYYLDKSLHGDRSPKTLQLKAVITKAQTIR